MAAAPLHAPIAVLGAGPAGLTAAYVLASRGRPGIVFEADDQVGGIAKTVEHDGFRFDLGGHRFFTKVPWVQAMWERIRPRGARRTPSSMSSIDGRGYRASSNPPAVSNALRRTAPSPAQNELTSPAERRWTVWWRRLRNAATVPAVATVSS
jgi:phytoene dehydrogenase-like protein